MVVDSLAATASSAAPARGDWSSVEALPSPDASPLSHPTSAPAAGVSLPDHLPTKVIAQLAVLYLQQMMAQVVLQYYWK